MDRASRGVSGAGGLVGTVARTRIRWRNVGRLGGGVAVAAIALFGGAELLEPPPPQSLPADLGLASGASGVQAYAGPEPAPRRPLPERRPERAPEPSGSQHDRPPTGGREETDGHRQPARQGTDAARAPTRTPATPPPPTAAAMGDPPPIPPTPTVTPPPPPSPSPQPAGPPAPADVEAEFGFEPRPPR